jgi:hypothetical protein
MAPNLLESSHLEMFLFFIFVTYRDVSERLSWSVGETLTLSKEVGYMEIRKW